MTNNENTALLSHTTNYPKFKCFRIGHLNITGLIKHINELKAYLYERQFKILAINETRLDSKSDIGTVDSPS